MPSNVVCAQAEKSSSSALTQLKEYLCLPSVSAQKRGINETADFLHGVFKSMGLEVSRVEAGGNPVIFAQKRSRNSHHSILFYNHYDVQPAEPLEEWHSPPFEPTIREGKLFARGVADNKANLISRIAAVKAYLDAHEDLPVTVKFVVDGEEEIGSPHLRNFVEQAKDKLTSDLCIWESSYKDEAGRPQIVLGCKGLIHGEMVARGANVDLHSSRAVIVENPAWRLVWALASVKDASERILIKGFYDDIVQPDEGERALVENLPFEEKKLLKTLGLRRFINNLTGFDLVYQFFYAPAFTLNGWVGGYQGEGSKTVLPKEVRAKFDIRLVPNMRPDDIVAKMRRHLDTYGFRDVELEHIHGYPPARTPYHHPLVRVVQKAGQKAWGQECVLYPHTVGSGPMYLFREMMPCMGIGVGHAESNIHAPNESVYVDDFYRGIQHIVFLLSELAEV